MPESDHPALRPTRYHWAAGLHPLHWLPACGGWLATLGLSLAGPDSAALSTLASVAALGAIGWSMTWLLLVPVMPAFRRVVDSRLAQQYDADFYYQREELLERYPVLKPELRELSSLRDRAREMMLRRFGKDDPFAQDNLKKLDTLAVSYIELLEQLTDYDDYLRAVNPDALESDIAEARDELNFSGPEIREVRKRQLELLQNRLERYRLVEQRAKLLKAEASSIETTMKLLADQAMSSSASRGAWDEIDGVLDNIRESELLSADLAMFDEFERRAGRNTTGQ